MTAATSISVVNNSGHRATAKRITKPATRGKAVTGPRWFLVYEADEDIKFRPFDTLAEALDAASFSSSAYKIFEAVDRQEATSNWRAFLTRTTKGQEFWDSPKGQALSRHGGK